MLLSNKKLRGPNHKCCVPSIEAHEKECSRLTNETRSLNEDIQAQVSNQWLDASWCIALSIMY